MTIVITIAARRKKRSSPVIDGQTGLLSQSADDLSAEFGVLRAPTVEYGVNVETERGLPTNAWVRRKTLHRLLNDLLQSWESGGVREFILLTAHGTIPDAVQALRRGVFGYLPKADGAGYKLDVPREAVRWSTTREGA